MVTSGRPQFFPIWLIISFISLWKASHATTSTFRPNRARIKILQRSRQLSDDIHFGQLRENGLHPSVIQVPFLSLIIQLVVAVEDKDNGEIWLCDVSPVMEQIHLTVCITDITFWRLWWWKYPFKSTLMNSLCSLQFRLESGAKDREKYLDIYAFKKLGKNQVWAGFESITSPLARECIWYMKDLNLNCGER